MITTYEIRVRVHQDCGVRWVTVDGPSGTRDTLAVSENHPYSEAYAQAVGFLVVSTMHLENQGGMT